MPIETSCPNPECLQRYSVPDRFDGREMRCKICGCRFLIRSGAGELLQTQSAIPNPAPTRATTPGDCIGKPESIPSAGSSGGMYSWEYWQRVAGHQETTVREAIPDPTSPRASMPGDRSHSPDDTVRKSESSQPTASTGGMYSCEFWQRVAHRQESSGREAVPDPAPAPASIPGGCSYSPEDAIRKSEFRSYLFTRGYVCTDWKIAWDAG